MFISLLVGFPLLFIFHCLVHALFKSLLFLVAGSLIHVQSNSQSIFKLRYFNSSFNSSCFNYSCSNSLIRSLFIIGGYALILSFSKEGIIHSSSFICNSSFIFQCLVLGGFFTCCYLFRIYFLVFSFNSLLFSFNRLSSFSSFSSSSFYLVCFSFFSFNSFLFDITFPYFFSCSSFFYSIFNFHDSFFFIDFIPFSLLFPYFIFLFFSFIFFFSFV